MPVFTLRPRRSDVASLCREQANRWLLEVTFALPRGVTFHGLVDLAADTLRSVHVIETPTVLN
jgi:hypothetical protein